MAEVPDEAVELLAHDYYDRERYTYEKPWDELPDGERKSYRDDARTTLAAIAASGANRIVAGGVTVPDEMVEAFIRGAMAEYGPNCQDAEVRAMRAKPGAWDNARRGLAAALEHYLRSRIRAAEPEPDDARLWEHIAEMSKAAALRTAMVDVLRAAAAEIRRELVCCDVYARLGPDLQARNLAGEWAEVDDANTKGHQICYWGEAAAVLNEARADELERGGDRG